MREYIKLCDVCDFQGGSQPPKNEWSFDLKDGYIRMLQIRDFTQSERVAPEYIKITKATKICEVDDILIARYGASLGKVLTGLAGAYNVAIMKTIPDTNVLEKKYLYYYLKSPIFQGFLLNVGSRAAQAGFNKNDLQDLLIPNITRNEQVEIVGTLERVETVIEARQNELQKLDDLIKARFVELFGDPIKNPKGWDVVKLSECLERIDNGKSFTCDSNAREGVFPAILKLSAATYGDYRPYENKALLDEKQFVESVEVHRGDLLFTRKNTPDLVGMAAYVFETPEKLMMPDLIFRLVTNERMTPIFLWQLINNREFRPAIQGISGGSAKSMSNISKERLKNIEVICPPISEQKKLEGVLEQVDKSKLQYQLHTHTCQPNTS